MFTNPLLNKQVLRTLILLSILIYFTTGMLLSPSASRAEEIQGDFQLAVGQYRGLTQEPSVPVNVRNAAGLVALEFLVESDSIHHLDVAVEGVERGDALPADATVTWSGTGHGDVKISIYFHENPMYGSGELVRIKYGHTGTEQTYSQIIDLKISDHPDHMTIRVMDEEGGEAQTFNDGWGTRDLKVSPGTLANGFIDVDVMYGDLDKNEEVSINDAFLALRASVGELELTPQLIRAGDVKRAPGANAKNITVHDALLIARKAVGLLHFFPVSLDPETGRGNGENGQSPFMLQPSSIWIGDYQLRNQRTVVGGDVTFTVKFPQRISGDVKLEISGPRGTVTNTEFINNATAVEITVDLTGQAGGGERVVSAYQYDTVTKETGIPLERFLYLVDKEPVRQLSINETRTSELDFTWPLAAAAKSIAIRQSLDNSAWTDASTAEPIHSTDTSATVTSLDPRRGYYFKLMTDYGVHAGESAVLRYNRMTENAIAYQIDEHMVVFLLYTGPFVELNQSAHNSFFMVGRDNSGNEFEIQPDKIGLRSRNEVVMAFLNNNHEDFRLTYRGAPDLLDNDPGSYVLQNDTVIPVKGEPLSELVVTSEDELKLAVEIFLAEKIILGNDITADIINIKWPIELDGAGYTLNSDIAIDSVDVTVKNLNIDSTGNIQIEVNEDARFDNVSFSGDGTGMIRTAPGKTLILNGTIIIDEAVTVTSAGAQLAGNSATITGPAGSNLIFANGTSTARNLNITGDLLVTVADDVTFEDVRIDADLAVRRGIEFINNVSMQKVTIKGPSASFSGDATLNRLVLQDNLQLTGKLGFTGSQATLIGANKRLAGPGTVELRSSGANVEEVIFGIGITVDIFSAANCSDVTFHEELVSANTGNSFTGCTFKKKLVINEDGNFEENTYEGGELEINQADIEIAGGTFTANVAVSGSGTGVSFEDVIFKNDLEITATDARLENCVLRGNVEVDEDAIFKDIHVERDAKITIADAKTLTLNGTVDVKNSILTFDAASGEVATVAGNATISTIIGEDGSELIFDGLDKAKNLVLKDDLLVKVEEEVEFEGVTIKVDMEVKADLTFEGDVEMGKVSVLDAVTFDGDATVNQLYMDNDLTINNGTLTFTGMNAKLEGGDNDINGGGEVEFKQFGMSVENVTFKGSLDDVIMTEAARYENVTFEDEVTSDKSGNSFVDSTFEAALTIDDDGTFKGNTYKNGSITINHNETEIDGGTFEVATTVAGDGTNVRFEGVTFDSDLTNEDVGRTYSECSFGNDVTNDAGNSTYDGDVTGTVTNTSGDATYTGAIDGTVSANDGNPEFQGVITGEFTVNSDVTFNGARLNFAGATAIGANTVKIGPNGLRLGSGQELTLNVSASKLVGSKPANEISGDGSVKTEGDGAEIEDITIKADLVIAEAVNFIGTVTTYGVALSAAPDITFDSSSDKWVFKGEVDLVDNTLTLNAPGTVIGHSGTEDFVSTGAQSISVGANMTFKDIGWSANVTVDVAEPHTLTFEGRITNNGELEGDGDIDISDAEFDEDIPYEWGIESIGVSVGNVDNDIVFAFTGATDDWKDNIATVKLESGTVSEFTVNAADWEVVGNTLVIDQGVIEDAATDWEIKVKADNYVEKTQDTLTIVHGAGTQLAVEQDVALGGDAGGADFDPQPVIHIKDQYGNHVTDSTAVVTATVGGETSGAWNLTGDTEVSAASGVATFSGLGANNDSDSVDAAGAYITFTSPGLDSVDSTPFTVAEAD